MLREKFSFSLRRLFDLAAGPILIIVAVSVATSLALGISYETETARTAIQVEQVVDAYVAQAETNVARIDEIVRSLAEDWTPDLGEFIKDAKYFAGERPNVALQISFVDTSGMLVWSSISGFEKADLSDREHIRVHLNSSGPAKLFISKLLIGRISKQPTVQFTRGIYRSGALKGVVVLGVPPSLLSNYYTNLPIQPHQVMMLVRASGDVLASSSSKVAIGEKIDFSGRHVIGIDELSRTINRGDENIIVSVPLRGENLAVVFKFSPSVAMSGYRSLRTSILISALLAAVLLIVLLVKVRGVLHRNQNDLNSAIRAHQLLSDHAFRLGEIVQQSTDAVVSVSSSGVLQSWNQAAIPLLKLPNDRSLSIGIDQFPRLKTISELSIYGDARKSRRTIPALVSFQEDGLEAVLEVMCYPVTSGIESVHGISIVARDVTAQQRLHQRIKDTEKMEALAQLTGGLAHDFNNLLGIIIGNLDLIGDDSHLSPTAKSFQTSALNAAIRGAELTRSLLAIARNQPLSTEPKDVNSIISELVPLLKISMGSESIVVLDLAPEELIVDIDAARLSNALLNLALNARDAMSHVTPRKLFTLRTRRHIGYTTESDWICIDAVDNGCGMSAEVLGHAFEPFYTTKAQGKGTGLGLSAVRGFVEQLGGKVQIFSQLNMGTTVELCFPPSQQSMASDATQTKLTAADC